VAYWHGAGDKIVGEALQHPLNQVVADILTISWNYIDHDISDPEAQSITLHHYNCIC